MLKKLSQTRLNERIKNIYRFTRFSHLQIKNYTINEDNPKDANECKSEQDKYDIKQLLAVIKCPMTDSNLEECSQGLKISHIIYPKRNGIYILKEDEAIFNF